MHLIVSLFLLYSKSLQLFILETLLSLLSLFMPSRLYAEKEKRTFPSASHNMPSLKKRHSWPPLHKQPQKAYFQDFIDEDPFSYFVSDQSESSDIFPNGVNAGIENTPRSRSYSPQHRKTLMSTIIPSSPTTVLKKWLEKMQLRCFRRSPRGSPPVIQRPMPSPEPFRPSKLPLTTSPPVRGRRDFRVGSANRVTPQGRSKPRRPRAWRAPSAELWPVSEDKEGENVGLGIMV